MYTHVVVHYGEIGIKGKNRARIEKLFINNIREALKGLIKSIHRYYGRVIIELNDDSDIKEIEGILKNIPGVAYFSFAVGTTLDFEKIEKYSLELSKDFKGTFKVDTTRSFKGFPMNSMEVSRKIGASIVKEYGYSAEMKDPDNWIFIEITEHAVFIYNRKVRGVGGLPVGMSGRLVSLISGGIDSPVASYMMMKRGVKSIYVHFYNYTQGSTGVKDKIINLVNTLNKFQNHSKIYMIPFQDIQMEVIKKIPADYRMIVYKRVMLKIAERIAKRERALGLVMGDSLAQVASQTLENLNTIYNATELNVYSPLIGFDKQEIVDMAKDIGTYETSIEPYEDCCTFMIAPHPATKSRLDKVEQMEERLEMIKHIEEAVANAEIIRFNPEGIREENKD